MKYFAVLLGFLAITIPVSVCASGVAKGPKITSVDSVTANSSVIHFSHPELVLKRVKVYASLRWKTKPHKGNLSGIEVKSQNFFITLDKNGNGAVQLKNLQSNKSYGVSLTLKRLEPSVRWTEQSKWMKFLTLH